MDQCISQTAGEPARGGGGGAGVGSHVRLHIAVALTGAYSFHLTSAALALVFQDGLHFLVSPQAPRAVVREWE